MDGLTQWRGKSRADDTYACGYFMRRLQRIYWTAFFTKTSNTLWRDGKMSFNGTFWHSETSNTLSYPYAITDDYGDLVPVKDPIYG